MIVGEEHRLWSSALCCLLHSPITLSNLGSDIFVRTVFSAYISSSMWQTQFHTHKKYRQKYSFVFNNFYIFR
jgi:hypothetical protein